MASTVQHIYNGETLYTPYEYTEEKEFEKQVIANAAKLFGPSALYIDIKKRIGEDNILTIPDGYLIDASLPSSPKLFIIENELATHDPYRHIGQQLLKFAISYKVSGRAIKTFLLDNVLKDEAKKKFVEHVAAGAGYRNVDALFEAIIFEEPVSAIIVIDEITQELESVVSQLTMKIDILEFQTFECNGSLIHKFTPFQPELRDESDGEESSIDPSEYDTIVVPAMEEGFRRQFLENHCWFKIRISSAMLDRIKYIAAYQSAPVSAVTYYAEVSKIEKYKDSGKYILYFKDAPKSVGPLNITDRRKGVAPQGPRYTTFEKLITAKKLEDLF